MERGGLKNGESGGEKWVDVCAIENGKNLWKVDVHVLGWPNLSTLNLEGVGALIELLPADPLLLFYRVTFSL